jgi:hypothetical protein
MAAACHISSRFSPERRLLSLWSSLPQPHWGIDSVTRIIVDFRWFRFWSTWRCGAHSDSSMRDTKCQRQSSIRVHSAQSAFPTTAGYTDQSRQRRPDAVRSNPPRGSGGPATPLSPSGTACAALARERRRGTAGVLAASGTETSGSAQTRRRQSRRRERAPQPSLSASVAPSPSAAATCARLHEASCTLHVAL